MDVMTEDVTLVGVREEDVEGRVWVQMRPPKGTMTLVCLRKRWDSGRVEEWRDRKYWPQMLSETWPWLFRSVQSDLVTATCHKHTLIYTWSFPRGTSGQDHCLHCGWDKDLFRTSLCLSSYSHWSVTTVRKFTHCRRVLDWSNTNKVGLIIFKPTVVQELIWKNKRKQTTAQAVSCIRNVLAWDYVKQRTIKVKMFISICYWPSTTLLLELLSSDGLSYSATLQSHLFVKRCLKRLKRCIDWYRLDKETALSGYNWMEIITSSFNIYDWWYSSFITDTYFQMLFTYLGISSSDAVTRSSRDLLKKTEVYVETCRGAKKQLKILCLW